MFIIVICFKIFVLFDFVMCFWILFFTCFASFKILRSYLGIYGWFLDLQFLTCILFCVSFLKDFYFYRVYVLAFCTFDFLLFYFWTLGLCTFYFLLLLFWFFVYFTFGNSYFLLLHIVITMHFTFIKSSHGNRLVL